MIHAHGSSRVRVPEGCMIYCSPSELARLLHAQIPVVAGVEYSVRIDRARADAEPLSLDSLAFAIDVIEAGTCLIPSGNHRAHREAHALVGVESVGEELGRAGDGDAALVVQFIKTTLDPQISLPKLTVGGAPSHCAQKIGVDLDHLLHRLRGNEWTLRGTRVHGNHNAALEDKCEGCGAVSRLNQVHGFRIEAV